MEFAYELVNNKASVLSLKLIFLSLSIYFLVKYDSIYVQMPQLSFSEALRGYFTSTLNAVLFIQYFLFSFSLVVLTLPKKINKMAISQAVIKFVVLYVLYVFGESLFFALSNLASQRIGGLLFTASFAVFPIAFLTPLVKDHPLHKAIKIAIMASSLMVTAEIGRLLAGIIEGNNPNDITFPIVTLRCFPLLFLPFIAFVLYRFNIARFVHLPLIHVIMILSLSVLLVVSAIWQNGISIESNDISLRFLLIFISFVELAISVGLYYSIYALIEYRHKVTELAVQSSVLAVEKESLMIDEKNREELIKIRHDLQNQLSYTQVLLNEGKYREASDYIQSLINQKEEYIYSFSCSNLVISGIVNLELTKAKIDNKKIKFKVVVPPKLPFEDSDLLSLITNIVDNSLENFVPQSDNDMINVSIVTQQDYLRITAFNSVDEKTIRDKPSLRTTKRGKAHGYGTKIIKNIVNKYEGHVSFTFEDNKFVCDCMINMNRIGVKNA